MSERAQPGSIVVNKKGKRFTNEAKPYAEMVHILYEKNKEEEETKYLHKGIGTRKFSKTVTLWEYWEVESADMNDGILYIVIKREIPEEKKPRVIKIK